MQGRKQRRRNKRQKDDIKGREREKSSGSKKIRERRRIVERSDSKERIDIQEEITVEVLLDSSMTELVMISEFTRKKGFKLKKIERFIYIRNVNSSFNKEGSIKHIVEVNIYY